MREFQEGKCGWEFEDYQQWRDYDGEGTTGFAVMDTAATTGLIGEETLKKWKQAYEDYGIKDGIKVVSKKTRLRFAKSKTKVSKKNVYLLVDVFGKAGRIEAAVVPGDMCLLFSRNV